jgi:hypothetical protein
MKGMLCYDNQQMFLEGKKEGQMKAQGRKSLFGGVSFSLIGLLACD